MIIMAPPINIKSKKDRYPNSCQYNRKVNYKKSTISTTECNICYNIVNKTKDNSVICGKSIHIICIECKQKLNDCPMCRSHTIFKPHNSVSFIRINKSEKKRKSNKYTLTPKQQKFIRRSPKQGYFPGKHNNYNKNKTEYVWKDDENYYNTGWIGSSGEYVSTFADINRDDTDDSHGTNTGICIIGNPPHQRGSEGYESSDSGSDSGSDSDIDLYSDTDSYSDEITDQLREYITEDNDNYNDDGIILEHIVINGDTISYDPGTLIVYDEDGNITDFILDEDDLDIHID